MKVMTRDIESKGRSIVHLEIGEPDFDTPENIKRAGIEAIKKGFTHYAPSQGLPELREEIADYIGKTRGISVSPDEVVVVPGGK
ncbi:MAG: aminotransferase class I/II-fold pyridoxal phosphate-dependent enzyme, partial [Caldisericaceae bacterium]|nr:aminotransferase class I/II-fold pyridoxal phosphate-dependent enzyme [Caldisericaceae bacterium]